MTDETTKLLNLLANTTATLIGLFIVNNVDQAMMAHQLQRSKENHALAEGTWTPYQLRLDRAGSILDSMDEQRENHCYAEGGEYIAYG